MQTFCRTISDLSEKIDKKCLRKGMLRVFSDVRWTLATKLCLINQNSFSKRNERNIYTNLSISSILATLWTIFSSCSKLTNLSWNLLQCLTNCSKLFKSYIWTISDKKYRRKNLLYILNETAYFKNSFVPYLFQNLQKTEVIIR